MLNIEFVLHDKELDNFTKQTIIRICELVNTKLELPNTIQVEYKRLSDSTYGELSLHSKFRNRVVINSILETHELITPLIHELIHVHQIHTGQLDIRRDSVYIWNKRTYHVENNMSYKQYLELPWETDVTEKLKLISKFILEQ